MKYTFKDETNAPALGGVLFKNGVPFAGLSDDGSIELEPQQAKNAVMRLIGYEDEPITEGVYNYILTPKTYEGKEVEIVANKSHVKLFLLIFIIVSLLNK